MPPRGTADLAIVGAGPAGLSAAIEAAAHGLTVVVFDEHPTPGGAVWRDAKDDDGDATIRRFHAAGVALHTRAAVTGIEPGRRVFWRDDAGAHQTAAALVLLATGAVERMMPLPGWTLPGVMALGVARDDPAHGHGGAVWIAGQGPLVLMHVAETVQAGGSIAGVLDVSAPGAWRRALPHLPAALRDLPALRRGVQWRRTITEAKVPWFRVSDIRAEGGVRLDNVSFSVDGAWHTEHADTLLLHDGIIPRVQITGALGCAHRWNATGRYWEPVTNEWGETSVAGVSIAGDGAGTGGPDVAALSGRIAALGAAAALGRLDSAACGRLAAPLLASRARGLMIRPLLDAVYAPRASRLDDSVIVCPRQGITAAQIRLAARTGGPPPHGFDVCPGTEPCPYPDHQCATAAVLVRAEALGVPVPGIAPFPPRSDDGDTRV